MRTKILLTVLVLGAVVFALHTRVRAEKKPPLPPPPPRVMIDHPHPDPSPAAWPKLIELDTVVGVNNETPEKAKQIALRKACDRVADYLQRLDPPVAWTPTPEFLQKEGFIHAEVTGEKDEQGNFESRLTIAIPQGAFLKIMTEERQSVAADRQFLGAKAFGVLLALVLAVGGYFYLDEATKGYYTVLLRVAALALVGSVGLVVWLVVR